MNIRNTLLNKLHNTPPTELKAIIFPDLEVLFEEYYNSPNKMQKDETIQTLCNLLK